MPGVEVGTCSIESAFPRFLVFLLKNGFRFSHAGSLRQREGECQTLRRFALERLPRRHRADFSLERVKGIEPSS